jgi:predicted nucleic acid-binding protein
MIFVDSDVMIEYFRGRAAARQWVRSVPAGELHLPGYVAMEIIQGCKDARDLATTVKVLQRIPRVWPTPEVCEKAVTTFASFRLSHSIGLLDAIVGELALHYQVPLYTFNRKHFSVIAGLQIIEPYQRTP